MCECAIHTTKKKHDWFGGERYRLAHLFDKWWVICKPKPTSFILPEQYTAVLTIRINLRVIYAILITLLLFDGDRLYASSVCSGNTISGGLYIAATASETTVFCEPPSITTQPIDQIDCKGRIVSFSVVATGSGLTYTWQRKKPSEGSFTNIPVESNVTYPTPGTIRLQNVGNSFAPDGTKYQVVVSNANCSVTSNPATLTINEITDIKPISTDVTKCYGNNYSYTVTTSYPSNVISYQWKKSVSPGVWVIVTDGGSISGAT
ncbi:MAG: immunoglobulin domain-containing protein, partial [Bacteroidales bacterium]